MTSRQVSSTVRDDVRTRDALLFSFFDSKDFESLMPFCFGLGAYFVQWNVLHAFVRVFRVSYNTKKYQRYLLLTYKPTQVDTEESQTLNAHNSKSTQV